MNAVKIDSLEIENVKRVKAVAIEPAENGLTVIGGRNGQGKTSVLDSIAWALGGNRRKPSDAKREGAATDPRLRVTLSNGLVVERKGKNSELKVTDPEGKKSGQQLLDSFVEDLALDLPKFLESTGKEKALTLLGILGIGDELAKLEAEEERLANQRLQIGQMARQKRGAADELAEFPEAPESPVSASELIEQQQAILARNGENQRKREHAAELERAMTEAMREAQEISEKITELAKRLEAKNAEADALRADVATAKKTASQLTDESTAELEHSIAQVDEINAKVRANQLRADAEKAADELEGQYSDLNQQVEDVRTRRLSLLDGAKMPIDGLTVDGGELMFGGQKWDCMSGSEQMRVATAIVRRLKPECGFVLVDKLEQLDSQTLEEFGEWAESEGLQVIATRVSTGEECSIVIEDGYAAGSMEPAAAVENHEDETTGEPVFNFPGKEQE